MSERYPLVVVRWQDAHGVTQEWQDAGEVEEHMNMRVIRSVGYVLNQPGDDVIHVAPHMTCEGEVCGVMAIPSKSVIDITNLDTTTREGAAGNAE